MAGEKILFVDDEEQIRKLVTAYLDRRGYKVTAATDGLEALKMIALALPDLVITDVRMPNMTGLELTHRLRASRMTARLPIIMLSAYKETDDVLAGYDRGADEYVPKPVEMAILGAKVEGLLRRSSTAGIVPTKRGVVIAFLHGKGGVGTTTLAVNVGVALSKPDVSRAILVDLNCEYANADMLLDVSPLHHLDELAMYDPAEVDQTTLTALLTAHSSGLSILAGPASPEAGERITPALTKVALDHLRNEVDVVLVDLPATFSEVNLAVIDAADAICVVTSADLTSLKATRECLRIVHRLDVIPPERTMLVLNRTSSSTLTEDRIAAFLGYVPDLVVPYDARFQQAGDEGKPLVSSQAVKASGRAIMDVAKKLESYRTEKREAVVWAA